MWLGGGGVLVGLICVKQRVRLETQARADVFGLKAEFLLPQGNLSFSPTAFHNNWLSEAYPHYQRKSPLLKVNWL